VCLTSPQGLEQATSDQPAEPDDRRALALGRQERGELLPSRPTQGVGVPLAHDLLVVLPRREHVHWTAWRPVFFPRV